MTKDARRVCEAALTMEHANLEKAKSALRKTQSDPTKTKSDRTKAEADVTRAERDLNRVQFGEPPCWAFLDPEKRRAHAGKADHISCVVLGASTSATPAT